MASRNGNGNKKMHRHQWKTIIVSSQGSRTQRCVCKAVPECQAARQLSPDGHCISLRENTPLEVIASQSLGHMWS